LNFEEIVFDLFVDAGGIVFVLIIKMLAGLNRKGYQQNYYLLKLRYFELFVMVSYKAHYKHSQNLSIFY